MKLIIIKKTDKYIMHGTTIIVPITTDQPSCEHTVHDKGKVSVGEAITTEVRKLEKGEEYQIEINGKNSGKVLIRRK